MHSQPMVGADPGGGDFLPSVPLFQHHFVFLFFGASSKTALQCLCILILIARWLDILLNSVLFKVPPPPPPLLQPPLALRLHTLMHEASNFALTDLTPPPPFFKSWINP